MDARSYFVIIILCCFSSAKSYGQQHPPDSSQLPQPKAEDVPQSNATQTGTVPVEAPKTDNTVAKDQKKKDNKQPTNTPKAVDGIPKSAQKPLLPDTTPRYRSSFDTCCVRVAQLKRENIELSQKLSTLEKSYVVSLNKISSLNDWLLALLGCSILLCSFLLWHIKKIKPKNNLLDNKGHLNTQQPVIQPFTEQRSNAGLFSNNYPVKGIVHGELLMSAGPRKKHQEDGGPNPDFDLGEDVAGLMTVNNQTIFWLMDGTSDSDEIRLPDSGPFFSSRLLAQTLGWKIREVLTRGSQTNTKEVLMRASQAVRMEWEDQIRKLRNAKKTK
jgi:hypothetical protein